jgi:hypothetical protein
MAMNLSAIRHAVPLPYTVGQAARQTPPSAHKQFGELSRVQNAPGPREAHSAFVVQPMQSVCAALSDPQRRPSGEMKQAHVLSLLQRLDSFWQYRKLCAVQVPAPAAHCRLSQI